ncbi:hypothetical protein B8V81_0146 [Paenibacillus pasadenensis]|uniref:Lipoprotein n=1 Tax=Paenibacillus pasadenensis TaxID=217090 RepID=A0A2N5NCF9_9BACL|nr:hypothetical protein [Paenibacillus pasadenensis]PLT48014.1 hypothetical protein B8V81_0146 [Paenibacillus pasadenensis]
MNNRRKPAVLLLAAALMMLLAACQENRNDAPAPTSAAVAPSPSAAPTEAPSGTPAASPGSEVIKEGSIEKEDNVVLKELSFVYKDQNIALQDIVDDAKLESLLGKPEEKKSHTYAENDGTNRDNLIGFTENAYAYPGLVIQTINSAEGKKFFIFNIEITDPKYATIRNVKVGDSVDQLKEAYPEGRLIGEGAADEEDDFRYEPANYVDYMTFHIKDAKIESIRITTLLD